MKLECKWESDWVGRAGPCVGMRLVENNCVRTSEFLAMLHAEEVNLKESESLHNLKGEASAAASPIQNSSLNPIPLDLHINQKESSGVRSQNWRRCKQVALQHPPAERNPKKEKQCPTLQLNNRVALISWEPQCLRWQQRAVPGKILAGICSGRWESISLWACIWYSLGTPKNTWEHFLQQESEGQNHKSVGFTRGHLHYI